MKPANTLLAVALVATTIGLLAPPAAAQYQYVQPGYTYTQPGYTYQPQPTYPQPYRQPVYQQPTYPQPYRQPVYQQPTYPQPYRQPVYQSLPAADRLYQQPAVFRPTYPQPGGYPSQPGNINVAGGMGRSQGGDFVAVTQDGRRINRAGQTIGIDQNMRRRYEQQQLQRLGNAIGTLIEDAID